MQRNPQGTSPAMNLLRKILWLPLILAQIAAANKRDSTAHKLHVASAVRTMGTEGFQLTKGGHMGPWLLRIVEGSEFACGASYISALYALTSANCMHPYRSDLSSLAVQFFAPDKEQDEDASVNFVYVPREWQLHDPYMDVAVVELSNRLRGNFKDFVRLCTKPLPAHDHLDVVACNADPVEDARVESIKVLDRVDCEGEYGNFALRETVACGKELASTKYCMFDPGCPVSAGEELCGIVAWGPETCKKKLPGIFTDLYQARNFIKKVIGGHKKHKIQRTGAHGKLHKDVQNKWPEWRSGYWIS